METPPPVGPADLGRLAGVLRRRARRIDPANDPGWRFPCGAGHRQDRSRQAVDQARLTRAPTGAIHFFGPRTPALGEVEGSSRSKKHPNRAVLLPLAFRTNPKDARAKWGGREINLRRRYGRYKLRRTTISAQNTQPIRNKCGRKMLIKRGEKGAFSHVVRVGAILRHSLFGPSRFIPIQGAWVSRGLGFKGFG
jgi:hypothetical protein